MKRLSLLFMLLLAGLYGRAQTTCNANSNLVLFTNYDGGVLNINVDVNIPNIKIGICSYEAVTVNLTGTYVGNVTAVRYAGYNSGNNTNCGNPSISTTTINGAPASATVNIVQAPPSPVSNSFGYGSIICGYSCSTTTSQGGCNTLDQIETYFMGQFGIGSVRMHKVQYGCWQNSTTLAVSGGGNCCNSTTPPTLPLAVTVTPTAAQCWGQCTGTVTAVPTGGNGTYTYQWTGGPTTATWNGRCPGTYTVTVTSGTATVTATGTVTQPAQITNTVAQTACKQYFFNGAYRTASGTYKDTLTSVNGCDSFLTLNLTVNSANTAVTQVGNTLTAAAGGTYKWYNCDSSKVVANATAQTFTPTRSGRYAVIITQNNCTDTSTCRQIVATDVKEAATAAVCKVYPNPTSGEISLQVAPVLLHHAYTVSDGQGRIVMKGVFESTETQISLRHLASGIYLLKADGLTAPVRIEKR